MPADWRGEREGASAEVLRSCLINGVQQKVFALAAGSAWDAPDAVIRFGTHVDPGEIEFQEGIWLVRAATAQAILNQRVPEPRPQPDPPAGRPDAGPDQPRTPGPDVPPDTPAPAPTPKPSNPTHLTVRISGVPADKARDVIKAAVLPFAAEGAEVSIDFTINADAAAGISSQTLDLIVKEGLRQLGVEHNVSTE